MKRGIDILEALREMGCLRFLDLQLASLAARMIGEEVPGSLLLALALASHAVHEGHACLDLKNWSEGLQKQLGQDPVEVLPPEQARELAREMPEVLDWKTWRARLVSPSARTVIGEPGEARLFILDESRLYLRRFWQYERATARLLEHRTCPQAVRSVPEELLERYFPADPEHALSVRQQRAAALKAVAHGLTLLSGGPGTGKTYVLARTVALLATLVRPSSGPLRVLMAAPTGKAAKRVVESLTMAKQQLRNARFDEAALAALPDRVVTIHRLLGARPNSPYFKHDAGNPLAADLVIVDEASMIDLPLMAKLLEALPETCRLMLVGDRHQLASVEPGNVFGDLCDAARQKKLGDCLAVLTESRRFPADSAIGRVSAAIRDGDPNAWDLLLANRDGILSVAESREALRAEGALDRWIDTHYRAFLETRTPDEALAKAGQCRILCALRKGPLGIHQINRRVEQRLFNTARRFSARFYDHQLVMVTVNTPALDLDNGDVGVVLEAENPANGTLRLLAWFPGRDGTPRSIPVNLLPENETAFAMTIHKSQGSEFPYLAIVLPDRADAPILTRELLYTGLTRVKVNDGSDSGGVLLFCGREPFRQAVLRGTSRRSGLLRALNA